MQITFYFDKRTADKKLTFPLKLRIYHRGQTRLVPSGLRLRENQWSDKSQAVINHTRAAALNDYLEGIMTLAMQASLTLRVSGKLESFSISQISRFIQCSIDGEEFDEKQERRGEFVKVFRDFIAGREKERTKKCYSDALDKLYKFDPQIEQRSCDDITLPYIMKFDTFLAATLTRNARNVHHRSIRAVCNHAVTAGYTREYAYRGFKIRNSPTAKRDLTVKQMREFIAAPCPPDLQVYKDMFILMTFMHGINAVDLLQAKPSDIREGRLDFRRSKTGTSVSVKIEPEMEEIINRYKGTKYLLRFCDERASYESFLKSMDIALKKIGPYELHKHGRRVYHPLFPKLSQYWCRHTWATLASGIGIPNEVVADALGHVNNSVTDIYINYNRQRTDAAGRKVIDYILEKGTGTPNN